MAFGAAALLVTTPDRAQNLLERLWGDIKGDLHNLKEDLYNLKEDVREETAYVLGLLGYVYGYTL